MKPKIGIIGFGRFGKVLYRLLKNDFQITVYDADSAAFSGEVLDNETKKANNPGEVYESDTVFFAVPIEYFGKVISSHKKYFKNHLLIDVLSIKKYPAKVFKKYLEGTNSRALLAHPMFGPDSSKQGFAGLTIVMDKFTANENEYSFWKTYFAKKGLNIVEMSADKHDQLAAMSQGVTHFIGRLLDSFGFKPTPIDTLGAKKLNEVMEQTCNDSWQLFSNLQNYNPYTREMRIKLGTSYDKIYNRLLPERINPDYLIYGIQGGVGSFNEQAILDYTKRKNIKKYQIKYLYTTKKVLSNLHKGNIDFGLFAIHNSVGGIVEESAKAMALYKFKIVEEFAIPVQHFLMKRKDVDFEKIKTIMAHPQVFLQCRKTLAGKYSSFKLKSGKGNLVDTAEAAKALAENRLPENIAILGPKTLATLYNLDIVAENLQDDKTNNTSFFLVKR